MKIDFDLARKIIDLALGLGAGEAEVYAVTGRNLTVEVKQGEIESLEKSVDGGYAVRVIRDGSEGFSYSTDPSEFRACVERAVETSRWTERDPHAVLPEDGETGEVATFDPEVDGLDEGRAAELALRVEQAALESDTRITKTRKTSLSLSSGFTLVSNSRGIQRSFRSTSISSHTMVVAEEGGDSQTGWDYQGSRFIGDISFDDIGRSAAERALRLLGARKAEPSKADIILDHSVAVEFLGIFASALSAESVQKGKSLLAGKVGEQVISQSVDIADNALIDRWSGSRPFDAEGVATTDKTPVESGVLKGYLHSTRTASKDGTRSTGNAVRNGFKSPPSVGITNLFIRPAGGSEEKSVETLISGIDRGMLVTEAMGVHTANPISGDFSVGVTGIWIKGGTLSHPVKEAVISGNILELFSNIVACGDDLRFFGKMGAPSLLIRSVDISG